MADRPRIILALPDVTECATVAEWLVTEGFEPVRRPSPRSAAEEMRARPFDLLVADATVAMRDGLLAARCGGALSANRPGAEQGWRAFVDMIPTLDAASPDRRRLPRF